MLRDTIVFGGHSDNLEVNCVDLNGKSVTEITVHAGVGEDVVL